jgi:hypothetical protein
MVSRDGAAEGAACRAEQRADDHHEHGHHVRNKPFSLDLSRRQMWRESWPAVRPCLKRPSGNNTLLSITAAR